MPAGERAGRLPGTGQRRREVLKANELRAQKHPRSGRQEGRALCSPLEPGPLEVLARPRVTEFASAWGFDVDIAAWPGHRGQASRCC